MRAAQPPPAGRFTKTFDDEANGWIIRDGERWLAVCVDEQEADKYIAARASQPPGARCACGAALPPLAEWSMPSCPVCVEAAEDAARYRFLRQPGNAIVYAKDRNAWGAGASGHVRYDTPEQLDAAVDAARSALTKSAESP